MASELPREAFHLAIHFIAGGVFGFALGNARDQHGRLHLEDRLVALRFPDLLPVELGAARIHALGDHGAESLLDTRLDLPLDEYLGNRKVVHFHQLLDNQLLGFLLRLVLPLGENRLADGVAQFLDRAVIPGVLRKLVIHFRQVLAAKTLDGGVEHHRFAGQAGSPVVRGVGHFEIPHVAGRQAAQVFGEGGKGFGAADLENHLLLLHRLAFDSGEALERHHRIVAVLQRAGVDIGVIGLLLADLLETLVDVGVRDLGVVIRHFDVPVIPQFHLGDDFELGGEAQRLAIVEVDILDIGLSDHLQVLGLELFLEVLGNQVLHDLPPDLARELRANQRQSDPARAETRQFGALLDVQHDAFRFGSHFRHGNGNLQRMLATFN